MTRKVCEMHVYCNRPAPRATTPADCYVCRIDSAFMPQGEVALDAAREVRDRISEAYAACQALLGPIEALREMLDSLDAASELDDAEALDAFHAVMVNSNDYDRHLSCVESLQDDIDTLVGADLDIYSDRTLDYLRDVA